MDHGWSEPWRRLPWPTLFHHDLLGHVLQDRLDQNAELYYMSIWGLELLSWWHVQDSFIMLWIMWIEHRQRLTWFSSFATCISFQLQPSTAQPIPASWKNYSMHYHMLCGQSVAYQWEQCHLPQQPVTLCSMLTHLRILKRAWPSRLPLCVLQRRVKPRRALLISHCVGADSSTQWPVTAK